MKIEQSLAKYSIGIDSLEMIISDVGDLNFFNEMVKKMYEKHNKGELKDFIK